MERKPKLHFSRYDEDMHLKPEVQSFMCLTPPTYLTRKVPSLLISFLQNEKSGVEPPSANLDPITSE